MNDKLITKILEAILETIDIPESAYEKAENRYKDLGEWFLRPESKCAELKISISSQGSFRLGTVNRPVNSDDEYDLDVGCRICKGVRKSTHTQQQLKNLVGIELEDYRQARGIKSKRQEKHRCWRLQYADDLNFHMDVVPSIPEESGYKHKLRQAMVDLGMEDGIAQKISEFTGAITDNRLPNYEMISPDWRISNSEGYALWFESRVKLGMSFLELKAREARAGSIDELPASKMEVATSTGYSNLEATPRRNVC